MILYHVADKLVAQAILRDGFLDGTGGYLTERLWSGVWLSDRPLDANDGAFGDTVLAIEFSCHDKALAEYEWYEAGKSYRGSCRQPSFGRMPGCPTSPTI